MPYLKADFVINSYDREPSKWRWSSTLGNF